MNLIEAIRMNCRQATYLHEKKKEGKATRSERLGLWFHLLYCKFCNLFFRQVSQLEKASKNLGEASATLNPSAKATIQKSLEEEMKG